MRCHNIALWILHGYNPPLKRAYVNLHHRFRSFLGSDKAGYIAKFMALLTIFQLFLGGEDT